MAYIGSRETNCTHELLLHAFAGTGLFRTGFLLNSGSGVTGIDVALSGDSTAPALLALRTRLPANFAQTDQLS
ncbi:MAG: hypothetical protein CMJ70_07330 [Planctomycetaceae bacterium]|nr:hypothetical protein [Planctomycetaceae bacterium]